MLDDNDTTVTDDNSDDQNASGHPIQNIPEVVDGSEDENQFEGEEASPNVKGEEDVFSGSAPEGEPADIDDELAKVGLKSDYNSNNDPTAINVGKNLEDTDY